MLEHVRRDLILAVRLLRRSPLFTLTASASLAIGIGANTAIFAVANSLLFRPPEGIVAPESLVDIGTARGDGGLNPLPFSTYAEIARRATGFSGVYAQHMFPHIVSLTTAENPRAEGALTLDVTTNFFTVLGARPTIGRLFRDGDDESPVAVLDHRFWAKRFQSDPSVVGRVLRVNAKPVTILGVLAQGFQGTGLQT